MDSLNRSGFDGADDILSVEAALREEMEIMGVNAGVKGGGNGEEQGERTAGGGQARAMPLPCWTTTRSRE